MNFYIMTLFPEMIESALDTSITGRAIQKGIITAKAVNIRDYADNKHHSVDDYPYGGGAGMLMQAQPVYDCAEAIKASIAEKNGDAKPRLIFMTPQGRRFDQDLAEQLSREEDLIFLCGHYEGIDERVLEEIVTDEVSLGDFVLTGGELPALVMIDAISRLVPGVLGSGDSASGDSFQNGLLEYPQYSRPAVWRGRSVPEVLLSGDHKKVYEWRVEQSILRTKQRRPDLYEEWLRKEQRSDDQG